MKKKTMQLTIVTDGKGKIVAAAPSGPCAGRDVQVRLQPLAGQTLHEVDAQLDLKEFLADSRLMRDWLSRHRVLPRRGLVPKSPPKLNRQKRKRVTSESARAAVNET